MLGRIGPSRFRISGRMRAPTRIVSVTMKKMIQREHDSERANGATPLEASDYGASLPFPGEASNSFSLRLKEEPLDSIALGPDEEENVGASLPSAEEIRSTVNIQHSSSFQKRKKKILCIAVTVVCALVILTVGLAVGTKGTSASNQERFMQISAMLEMHAISTSEDLQNPNSPQYKAAKWLAFDDPARLPLPNTKNENELYTYWTRYIMVLNWFAMHGEAWWKQANFLSNSHVCQWNKWEPVDPQYVMNFGVHCDSNYDTSPENKIRMLVFYNNNLKGTFPNENGKLTSMRVVYLEDNEISGSIPKELCDITYLEGLYLGYNKFNGTLAVCFGQLSNLEILYLSNNRLTGKFPSNVENMRSLRRFYIDDNQFSGDIVQILQPLPGLVEVHAETNDFSGELNETSFAGFNSLKALDLSRNSIKLADGVLPSGLFKLPALQVLDLSDNSLRGKWLNPLPKSSLQFLSLHHNSLSGSLPTEISYLSSLYHLDLSWNLLNGSIPDSMGNLTSLHYFFIAHNPDLTRGSVPDCLRKLTKLEELSLRDTNRAGSLPEFLSEMTNLTLLDLSQNSLNGTIPQGYGNLTGLEFLLMNSNRINGSIPDTFSKLSNLRAALFDDTNLTGVFHPICSILKFENNLVGASLGYNGEILSADCGAAAHEVTCSCCTVCCNSTPCSDPVLPSISLQWETSYLRSGYNITLEGVFRENA